MEADGNFAMLVLTFYGVLVHGHMILDYGRHAKVDQQSIVGSDVDTSAQGNHRKSEEAAHIFEMFS